MKTKKIFLALSLIVSVGLMTQCEKNDFTGPPDGHGPSDDAKPWAGGGGNTDKGNTGSDSKKGGDYGDLYDILRDLENSGVPEMVWIVDDYYVQPVNEEGVIPRYSDIEGEGLEQTTEEELWGELTDPDAVIPVDFGRLNIVRSPQSVLDQALIESLKTLDPDGATVDIGLDFCGRLTAYTLEGVLIKTIDSPRENMALFQYIMNNGFNDELAFLADHPELEELLVAASCFSAGSDKTGTVNVDEVVYINGFMGIGGNLLDEVENEYFNFNAFEYDRATVYGNRYIQFLIDPTRTIGYPVNELGYSAGPIFPIDLVMEGLTDYTDELFSDWNNSDPSNVEGFAMAVDDAVQVLEFIHGDNMIRSVPYSVNPYPGDE